MAYQPIGADPNTGALPPLVETRIAAQRATAIADYLAEHTAGGSGVTHVPLVLFIGESNSGGLAPNSALDTAALAARPSVLIWNNDTNVGFDVLDIGTNNLRGHTQITGVDDPLVTGTETEDHTRHGWENALARSAEAGQWAEQVYLLKAGQGGSKISDWDPTDPYWTTFVTRITAAVADIRDLSYEPDVYIFATIGGNDWLTGTSSSDFKTQLVSWIARVRAQITALTGVPYPPMAFALREFDTAYPARLAEIAATDPLLMVVQTDDATLMADTHHWDAPGMLLIGTRLIDVTLAGIGQAAQYPVNTASPHGSLAALAARVAALEAGGGGGGSAPGSGSVVAADTFNRADSTTTMGVTETGGFTWTPLVGTWGIASGRAYSVSGNSSDVVAFQTPGVTDGVYEARLAVKGVSNLLWRVVDADDWYSLYVGGGGDAAVYKSVGGNLTLLANTTGSGSADGDLFTVRVSGSEFVVSRNGIVVATVTDTVHASGGWGLAGQGSGFRWDDVSLQAL